MKNLNAFKLLTLEGVFFIIAIIAGLSWFAEIILVNKGILPAWALYTIAGFHITAFFAPLLFTLWISDCNDEWMEALLVGIVVTLFAVPLVVGVVLMLIVDYCDRKTGGQPFLEI